jgi:predicted DNA-binding transcriptional regulator AlpA
MRDIEIRRGRPSKRPVLAALPAPTPTPTTSSEEEVPPVPPVAKWRPLLSPSQASEYLGISERLLRASRQKGEGPPFVKLSRQIVRYRPEDLEAWVASKCRTSTQETA